MEIYERVRDAKENETIKTPRSSRYRIGIRELQTPQREADRGPRAAAGEF